VAIPVAFPQRKATLAVCSNSKKCSSLEGREMPACPECENALDVDTEDVEEGDVISCDECGTEFEVIATEPLQLSQVEDGYDDEDEELKVEEEE
jgi:alpha-aminoadipate carrier protein LysW